MGQIALSVIPNQGNCCGSCYHKPWNGSCRILTCAELKLQHYLLKCGSEYYYDKAPCSKCFNDPLRR